MIQSSRLGEFRTFSASFLTCGTNTTSSTTCRLRSTPYSSALHSAYTETKNILPWLTLLYSLLVHRKKRRWALHGKELDDHSNYISWRRRDRYWLQIFVRERSPSRADRLRIVSGLQ